MFFRMFSGRRLERYRQMSMRRAERRNTLRLFARLFGQTKRQAKSQDECCL